MSKVKAEEPKKEATTARRDRSRRPVNGMNTRLEVRGKEEGYHYCWVNEDNVDRFSDAGFDFVRHAVTVGGKHIDVSKLELGSQIWKNVGKGTRAFLMRQPDELHKEDLEHENQITDEQTAARLGDINSGGLSEINVTTSLGKK